MPERKTPQVRFKGFTDTWEQRKLAEVFTYYSDPVDIPHEGYERLGIRSHAKGTFHSYVPAGHELQTAQMHRVAANKVIVNITFGWEHAVAVTDENDAGKLVSHRFPQFSLSEEIDPKFLKFIILDENFRHHLWLASPGGAGRNRVLNLTEMLQYEIQIPTVVEQKQIADVLINLDTLITLHQREGERLQMVKKSMLENCLPKNGEKVPRFRFAGFTGDWEQRKLGDVCQVTMGQSPDGSTYSDTPSDYILVQGNADLKDGWVSPRIWTTQKTKTAEDGDLIMSVRAPAGSMGKTSYNVVLGRGVAGIKGNEFIYQSLVKMDSNGYWKKLAAGSTFESINSDVVNGAELMVPQDIDEQNKIGDYFASIDALITLHQSELEMLKKIKESMLGKMLV